MTRVEAIEALFQGKAITHPSLDFASLRQINGEVNYIDAYGNICMHTGEDIPHFFWRKQEIKWDNGWEEIRELEATE
ncbi:MAG: hypothetical protein LBH04_04880 [Tannerellaceae bacterium]|jgi:hypothetical protein|nr:hypothetical protein [Tannerellaceae bacterium]